MNIEHSHRSQYTWLATAFGYFATPIDSAYLLSKIWFLFIASFNFVLLLLDPEGSAGDSNQSGTMS